MLSVLVSSELLPFSEVQFTEHLNQLPSTLHPKILAFYQWQDRQRSLIGKLLLKEQLRRFDLAESLLGELQCTPFQRPFIQLSSFLDFNISHSGEVVVCAMSDQERVGIDVEKIRPLPMEDFYQTMSESEWREIRESSHPETTFIQRWTQKESVLKADGCGLNVEMCHLKTQGDEVLLDETLWETKSLKVSEGYSCHLASVENLRSICISHFNF